MNVNIISCQSHPAWVCGLKLFDSSESRETQQSHPAWVCGLKPGMENNKQSNTVVTPCVGVWIETVVSLLPMKLIEVTPCVGVWIETLELIKSKYPTAVTPCVGVWIETIMTHKEIENELGHTLRGCVD